MSGKKVAVLIPTLNEERTLKRLLDSLNANSYPNKEVIIIDGGSSDKTIKISKEAGATVLMEEGEKKDRCPANAWNQGARYAKADILAFLDADCIAVNRDFLKNGVNAFDKKTAAAYGGYKTVQDTAVERIISKKESISIHPTFIRKDVFMSVGGYPLIGFGEDSIFAELVRRYARDNSMVEKRVPESYWTGHAARSIGELYKQKKWYGRTSVMYVKNMKRLGRRDVFAGLAGAYAIPVYLLSFITLFFIPFSLVFVVTAIPFFAMFLATLVKNPGWEKGRVFTNLVSGAAMLHGLLVFIFSSKARKGR